MAKKKKAKRGRPKGSKNKAGPKAASDLAKSIGASGKKSAGEIQANYDFDVVRYAVKTWPRLPKALEDLASSMSKSAAKEMREKWLEQHATPF